MSWRYQNLVNTLQMKKNEIDRLSSEFEKSIRSKEVRPYMYMIWCMYHVYTHISINRAYNFNFLHALMSNHVHGGFVCHDEYFLLAQPDSYFIWPACESMQSIEYVVQSGNRSPPTQEEQHSLKKDLAALAIAMNMEAQKKRQMMADTGQQAKKVTAREIHVSQGNYEYISMDPRFMQFHPWNVRIHALRPTLLYIVILGQVV